MSDLAFDKNESTLTKVEHVSTLAAEALFKAGIQNPYNAISELTGYKLGKIDLVGELPGEQSLRNAAKPFNEAIGESVKTVLSDINAMFPNLHIGHPDANTKPEHH